VESPLSGDQLSVGSNNDGVQQAKVGDARGEPFNVAYVAAVALAEDDRADAVRMAMRGLPARLFICSVRAGLLPKLIDT
jgi:hypothetical protein